MSKPRFFIGIYEIGGNTHTLSQGLREMGYEVTNIVVESKNNPRRPYGSRDMRIHDRYIRNSNKFVYFYDLAKEFIKNSYSHDIFVFNFCSSFFSAFIPSKYAGVLSYLDLPLLKAMGKKIVFFANGSDLRSYRLLVEEMENDGLYSHAKYMKNDLGDVLSTKGADESMQKIKAKKIEKYADYIFARPNSAQLLARPYHLLWLPIDLSLIKYRVNQSDEPLIIHAPSNRPVKGTKYVLPAIKKLEREGYKFRFLLCETMRNEEFRKKLADADIVIDQLLLPGYGLLGIEAMASGNAVLGSAVPGYNGFSDEMPIIPTTPDNIYENLKMVLEDPDLRVELAKRGRKYVEKYHDYKQVTKDFLKLLLEDYDKRMVLK
jgi:glycosyltransferase involved in cell wall biosynthesis